MAGNAWEWVADGYQADYYQQSPAKNPQAPATDLYRGLRGGGWNHTPLSMCTSARSSATKDIQTFYIGFRCAAD